MNNVFGSLLEVHDGFSPDRYLALNFACSCGVYADDLRLNEVEHLLLFFLDLFVLCLDLQLQVIGRCHVLGVLGLSGNSLSSCLLFLSLCLLLSVEQLCQLLPFADIGLLLLRGVHLWLHLSGDECGVVVGLIIDQRRLCYQIHIL